MPSSTSAPLSASTSRAAYGAPEAPVMPRKTRTALLWTLGGVEEGRDCRQLRDAEILAVRVLGRDAREGSELRHDVVPELRRIRDVRLEPLHALPLRPLRAQVRRAEERPTGAEVRVARRTAGLREHRRPRNGLRVVRKALALRPARNGGDDLGGERLLRNRTLVGELAHRDDDEDRRDDGNGAAREPPLPARVEEREHERDDEQDRRDPDRAEDDRVRPLEDPQQVEEEVEVPVGSRDERERARVGFLVVDLPEEPRVARALVAVRGVARGFVPDDGEHDDDHHDNDAP